jgi:tRNA 2-thiouridine synthesizing protein A
LPSRDYGACASLVNRVRFQTDPLPSVPIAEDENGATQGTMDRTDLDLRHLRCPLPVLRTRKALRSQLPGTVLVVHCTDPLAAIDIPHALRDTGDELLSTTREADVLTFTIRKSAPGGRRP